MTHMQLIAVSRPALLRLASFTLRSYFEREWDSLVGFENNKSAWEYYKQGFCPTGWPYDIVPSHTDVPSSSCASSGVCGQIWPLGLMQQVFCKRLVPWNLYKAWSHHLLAQAFCCWSEVLAGAGEEQAAFPGVAPFLSWAFRGSHWAYPGQVFIWKILRTGWCDCWEVEVAPGNWRSRTSRCIKPGSETVQASQHKGSVDVTLNHTRLPHTPNTSTCPLHIPPMRLFLFPPLPMPRTSVDLYTSWTRHILLRVHLSSHATCAETIHVNSAVRLPE